MNSKTEGEDVSLLNQDESKGAESKGDESKGDESNGDESKGDEPTHENQIDRDYGYIIFNTMLKYFFPNREKNGDLGEPNLDYANVENFTSCFEDGAFVFNDPEHKLFDILLGANTSGSKCRLNELGSKKYSRSKYGSLDILKKTSHMIINDLTVERKRVLNGDWNIYQLAYNHTTLRQEPQTQGKAVYIKEKKKTLQSNGKWTHNGRTAIYERFITTTNGKGMHAICNPTYPALGNTSYLQKNKGKALLKFYCLKFVKKNNVNSEEKTQSAQNIFYLTFVKSETTQHGKYANSTSRARAALNSVLREKQEYELKATGSGITSPFVPNSSAYPYRKEKISIGEESAWEMAKNNDNWNKFFNGTRSCSDEQAQQCITEANAYSGHPVNDNIFPYLRNGWEFFVPSPVTAELVKKLNPLREAFCAVKYHELGVSKRTGGWWTSNTSPTSRREIANWERDHRTLVLNWKKENETVHNISIGGKRKKCTKKNKRKNKNQKRDKFKRKSRKIKKKKKTRKIY